MNRRDFLRGSSAAFAAVGVNLSNDRAREQANENNRVLALARETGRFLLTDNPDYPSVCFRAGGRHWRAEHCLAGWQLVELFDDAEIVRHTNHGGKP